MGIPTVKRGKEIQHIFVPPLELNSCFFLCACGKKSQKNFKPPPIRPSHSQDHDMHYIVQLGISEEVKTLSFLYILFSYFFRPLTKN